MASDVTLFLDALFAGKPDDLHILLWTLPEKRSHWFQNVGSAIQFAESMRARDLYVGVGSPVRIMGPRIAALRMKWPESSACGPTSI